MFSFDRDNVRSSSSARASLFSQGEKCFGMLLLSFLLRIVLSYKKERSPPVVLLNEGEVLFFLVPALLAKFKVKHRKIRERFFFLLFFFRRVLHAIRLFPWFSASSEMYSMDDGCVVIDGSIAEPPALTVGRRKSG